MEPKRHVRLSLTGSTASAGKSQGAQSPPASLQAWQSAGRAPGAPLPPPPPGSSIGGLLAPGVLILPALSLCEALRAYAGRLARLAGGPAGRPPGAGHPPPAEGEPRGGGGAPSAAPGAASAAPAQPGAHPGEPPARDLRPELLGALLLLSGLRKSTGEREIGEALAAAGGGGPPGEGGVGVERLDEHAALLRCGSRGRAAALAAGLAVLLARGCALPPGARVRLWGVGAEAALAAREAGRAAPAPPAGVRARIASSVAARMAASGGAAGGAGGGASGSATPARGWGAFAPAGAPAPSRPQAGNPFAPLGDSW